MSNPNENVSPRTDFKNCMSERQKSSSINREIWETAKEKGYLVRWERTQERQSGDDYDDYFNSINARNTSVSDSSASSARTSKESSRSNSVDRPMDEVGKVDGEVSRR